MTDMTVSFLFIVIILLAFFASQFRPDELVPKKELDSANELVAVQKVWIAELEAERRNAIEHYAHAADSARSRIILSIKKRVEEVDPQIKVTISEADGILRFRGDAFFASDQFEIVKPRIKAVVRAIAVGLDEELACFTIGKRSNWDRSCNPHGVLVEAIQIEGHTDQSGDEAHNLQLSLKRGAETFLQMEGYRPELREHKNQSGQSVLSVAGYGESRPIADDTDAGRALNRRIDLRLIMASVGKAQEIEEIRQSLGALADQAYASEPER